MSSKKKKPGDGNLSFNRKALHDYHVLERYEAGVALVGTEVKVVREGGASLIGAYIKADGGCLMLHQVNIPPYTFGNRFNHDSQRSRQLLMHKNEIRKLRALQEQKGLALIPLRLYLSARGVVKVEVGVCRGKNVQDKRETVKRRDADREARREMVLYR